MPDIETVMSWVEGLTQDDWRWDYSDSEVQETAKAALELLKKQTTSGWVSVKERLPEVGEKCLIADKKSVTVGSLINRTQGYWQWEDSDFYGRGGITHWMPMPEPPEVENEV